MSNEIVKIDSGVEVLKKLNTEIEKAAGYIKDLIGTPEAPKQIFDELTLKKVVENEITIKAGRSEVEAVFKNRKAAARVPYDNELAAEKRWLEKFDALIGFARLMQKEHNDRRRAEEKAREQAAADARAIEERARLDAKKAEAEASGNTEVAAQLEEAKKAVVVEEVDEKKFAVRTGFATATEKEVIEDFQITNPAQFISACIDAGLINILSLDKKTNTAMEKYLLATKDCNAFPGCKFKRGYDLISRKAKTNI